MNKCLALGLVLVLFVTPGFAQDSETPAAGSVQIAMRVHHLHLRLNHGLAMAAQGSNMVMTSQMGMSPHSDAESLRHGLAMIKQGRAVIEQATTGPEMQELRKADAGNSALMAYTHELSDAMLTMLMELEGMNQAPVSSSNEMAMHHIHILINHALLMASEGSRLIMLGQMDMNKPLDSVAVKHGLKMISEARNLWHEAIEGRVMKGLHKENETMSTMMAATHRHADAAKRLIDLFVKMSSAREPKGVKILTGS